MRRSSFLFLIAVFYLISPQAFASRTPSPARLTEIDLNIFHSCLERIQKECNRIPNTAEGLSAVLHRPSGFECPNKSRKNWECPAWSQDKDGWGAPLKFESTGGDYRITASHGYFLTSRSSNHNDQWWENPNGGERLPPLNFYSWKDFTYYLLSGFGIISFHLMRHRIGDALGERFKKIRDDILPLVTYGLLALFLLFTFLQLGMNY